MQAEILWLVLYPQHVVYTVYMCCVAVSLVYVQVMAEVDPDTLVKESPAVIEGECAFILNHKLSYELIIALLLHLFQRNLCSM